MELAELRSTWDELGRQDPLWAILTQPAKKGQKWDRAEFFKTGEHNIKSVMNYLDALKLRFPRDRALDFGCGVGRLTQALCNYFQECRGVDIAQSMIDLARQYNQHGSRCMYYVNGSDDLGLFEDNSFDFIYTNIVLQHIDPIYSKNYIKEFLRTLRPAGIVIFALPSDPIILESMPDSAFRAQITTSNAVIVLEAGSQATLNVKVKNVSDSTWLNRADSLGKSIIHLGNHWLSSTRQLVVHHDARASLPQSMKPGMESDLQLTVTAPNEPGNYIMVLDMVLEGVTWFHDKGSHTTDLQVCVKGSSQKQMPIPEPAMKMHNVPKSEVLDLLQRCKGRLIDIQPDYSAPGWVGYRYCATK